MRALAAIMTLTSAACSSPEQASAPPAMPDEQRALAEAKAMIPADELPAQTPSPALVEAPEQ
mgnify:CR=1 FL=1